VEFAIRTAFIAFALFAAAGQQRGEREYDTHNKYQNQDPFHETPSLHAIFSPIICLIIQFRQMTNVITFSFSTYFVM
jgi:hypothetical protein